MVPYLMYQAAVSNANKHRKEVEELQEKYADYDKIKDEVEYLRDTVKKLRRDNKKK